PTSGSFFVCALVDPELARIKAGAMPQAKNDPDVGRTIQAILGMGLQAYMQTNDTTKVKTLVEVYGKAIGEDPATTPVPEIVRRLVPIINTQIKEMRTRS